MGSSGWLYRVRLEENARSDGLSSLVRSWKAHSGAYKRLSCGVASREALRCSAGERTRGGEPDLDKAWKWIEQ